MAISFDCGTYNLVSCKRDKKGNFCYKREINAFIEMSLENKVAFNMMKKENVPLIERTDTNTAIVLGKTAVDFAYAMNLDLKRPMSSGCLNPKEKDAQEIMSSMIHGLVGECEPNELLLYTVPANAINEDTDAVYHSKVLESMFLGYKDVNGNRVKPIEINEALALVYAELESKSYTGIATSWGSGMNNVCFALYGQPIFSFSVTHCGDWIDRQAAKALGESPIFVNQEKLKLDLTVEPPSVALKTIKMQYEIMINKTVNEIKKGIEKMSSKARTNKPIDFVVAGGTASPKGFEVLFGEALKKGNIGVDIGAIIKPSDSLYAVARGALVAAEHTK